MSKANIKKEKFYKAIHGYNGIELKDAPYGFEAKVKWGIFKTEEEAKYSSNVGDNTTTVFKHDTLNEFSLDKDGFFLVFLTIEGKAKKLRYPDFEIVFSKYPDLGYITDDNMIQWDISIDGLYRELIETFTDEEKQIHYGYPFDSLYYGAELIEE